MAAGESMDLEVVSSMAPFASDPLPSDCTVTWAVSGSVEGVTIDSATGNLSIGGGAVVGNTFEVRATLGDGREVAEQVSIVQRGEGSLVGTFHEVARVPCGGGAEAPPANPVLLLRFFGGGRFHLAFVPFEARYDYEGSYTHDAESGALSMEARELNYLPQDVELEGTVIFDGDSRIRLRDMWLGSSPANSETPSCEHVFERDR